MTAIISRWRLGKKRQKERVKENRTRGQERMKEFRTRGRGVVDEVIMCQIFITFTSREVWQSYITPLKMNAGPFVLSLHNYD